MDAVLGKMLNSTIGTPDYKPLDELLLIGSRSLVASEEPFMLVDTNFVKSEGVYNQTAAGPVVDVCSIKPMIGGSMKVYANIGFFNDYKQVEVFGYLYVYINGALKYTFIATSGTGVVNVNGDLEGDISFEKNDTITFKLQAKLTNTTSASSQRYSAALDDILLKASITEKLIQAL